MLLVREESAPRFFRKKELPTDTCALLSTLTSAVDSLGNNIYYYSYDMSDFLTTQLRQEETDSIQESLSMVLVPVTVSTSSTVYSSTTVSAVKEQQTMSATKIRSAKNGMRFEIVYSGF